MNWTEYKQTPEYQMLEYRVYRSNAIWFCRQLPVSITHQNRPSENITVTIKDIKGHTESWMKKTISQWNEMKSTQHPYVLCAAGLHTQQAKRIEKITTAVTAATIGLVDKCLCPECMIDQMKKTENPELKIEYPDWKMPIPVGGQG